MALLSTGLGLAKGHGAISQTMCLDNSFYSRLKFRWKLYSAEFKKFCEVSGFDDTFRVVIQGSTRKLVLPKATAANDEAGYQIAELCKGSLTASDVKIPEIKKPQGKDEDTDGTFMTEWNNADFDISEMATAGTLTVTFEVVDKGDSAYDTAVLIDDVRLE